MKILAIETSCDETALALVEASPVKFGKFNGASGVLKLPKFRILKNLVSSQIAIHRPFGGVVPNLAKREHLKNLPLLFENLKLKIENFRHGNIIAVTVGPGLEPALWTGIGFAKEIYKKLKIANCKLKIVGANHLEGHLYSFLLSNKLTKLKAKSLFPAVSLIVSGGHTILVLMKSLTNWRKLGETRDDAVGEAFDKVARMLNLPYPGGPEIERLTLTYRRPTSISFPRPMIHTRDYDFSFSGLKTSVLYYLRDNPEANKLMKLKANVAVSFQQAAIDVLVHKTLKAAREFKARSIMLSGGVASNKMLRKRLALSAKRLAVNFFSADKKFQTDNAVIIAVAAYIQLLRRKNRPIRAQANLNL